MFHRSRLILILSLLSSALSAQTYLPGKWNDEVPRLENPFSVAYLEQHLKPGKPRLIYNEAILAQLKAAIQTDPVVGKLYQDIRRAAREVLEQPLIRRDKKTNAMLHVSRDFLGRMNALGLVYLMERDPAVLDRINRELLAVAAFKDWNPPVYLDTAEISLGVALALDWTLDDLPAETIARARQALIEKGIHPSWEEFGGNMDHAWFVDHYNNWNQVCNAGMIAAAIAIADVDAELAARTIRRAMEGLPEVLAENYYPDGVCPEGVMYWSYTTTFALLTLSMLETSFGSDFGYAEYPGFMESALFRVMCSQAPSGQIYNFADSKDVIAPHGDTALAWFAARTGNGLFWEKEKFMQPADMALSGYVTAAALSWMSSYKETRREAPPIHWVGGGDTPVAVFTGRGEGRGFYFAAKGGCGAVSHGNLDAGSFVFELDGVRWSLDPGIQSYMLGEQGFDLWRQHQASERWQLLTKNNHGHSTLTVNGRRHRVDGYVRLVDQQMGPSPSVTFDMTPAYGRFAGPATRSFTKSSPDSLLIEDVVTPVAATRELRWQLITRAEVSVSGSQALLTQEGKQLELIQLSDHDQPFVVQALDPPPHRYDKRIEGLKRIELTLPVPEGRTDPVAIKIQLRAAAERSLK